MTSQSPEVIAAIAGTMRSSISRRRLLHAAGLGGAAMVAAACGASDEALGGGGAGGGFVEQQVGAAEDMSAVDKLINWSNWPLYIDIDDETGSRPSLEAFQKLTGFEVVYTEDVNDNSEFYAKVRTQLEQGQDIGRDIVVLTDWMAALWIKQRLRPEAQQGPDPQLDQPAAQVLLRGLRSGPPVLAARGSRASARSAGTRPSCKATTGTDTMNSVEQLFDPALKGRVSVLSEMRDTMGILMAYQGADPSNFTDDEFNAAIELLTQQVDNGQIRQVTGNDYAGALESGDLIAVIGWSGDMIQLGEDFGVALPESGGTLWTDNMMIPALAAHKRNAELLMNYYYDPVIAAEVAAYVQYISPVNGAQEAMESIDPSLVDNQWIFPSAETLESAYVFMTLTEEKDVEYQRAFNKAIGG